MVWPLVAVLGISWILSVFDIFMLGMRWMACGVFLIMGALLIRNAEDKIDRDSRLTKPGAWSGFAAGLLAILGNPKAVLFYMGVLPGFFDLRVITWPDVAAIVIVSVTIPLIGNLAIAGFVGRMRALMTNPATLKRINIVAGTLLILVGLLIPFL
jgi:threonine/homoserine/homoserine lactone efflux protein